MDPYATLGVARDASADDIKQAYRRAASAAHPDKHGGSGERMATVNRANDILSDAEKRARFDATGDATGDAEAPPTLDDKATQALQQTFAGVLDDDGDIVAAVRRKLSHGIAQSDAHVAQLKQFIRDLAAKQQMVKTKGGVINLVHGLIEQRIGNLVRQRDELQEAGNVMRRALEMLESYEWAGPKQAPDDRIRASEFFITDLMEAGFAQRFSRPGRNRG